MFVIYINELSLKIMNKNEMTLLPTQYISISRFQKPVIDQISFDGSRFNIKYAITNE